MTDGTNGHDTELKRRIDRRLEVLGEMAELKGRLDEMIEEDKNDGFNAAVMAKVVKEMGKSPEQLAAQLTAELELDTYRAAAGLPVTLEAAQKLVRESAESAGARGRGER